jgi:hypothetical protein
MKAPSLATPTKTPSWGESSLEKSAGASNGANCITRLNYENTILGDNVQTANNVII